MKGSIHVDSNHMLCRKAEHVLGPCVNYISFSLLT